MSNIPPQPLSPLPLITTFAPTKQAKQYNMLLIKNAKIIDPASKYHGKQRDVFIRRGKIEDIQTNISILKAKVIEAKGACLSPGWLDVGVQVADPGFEHREDIYSVTAAAAAGGYTGIVCQPNTMPVTHSKSEVMYLKNRTKEALVDCFPVGAVSRDCAGEDLTEMNDMYHHGAIAFSDGQKPIQDSGLMKRALLYAKGFDGVILNQPQDNSLAGKGQVHEGLVSTMLGMKGIPALAEEMMACRDIYLAKYTDSRLHLSNISCTNVVGMVKEARQEGLKVTSSAAVMNLIFEDEVMHSFNTNYKVLPPLREKKDIKALLKGLKNGSIDFISSNHNPQDEESKKVEFPYADFGTIGLQTTYALLNTYLGDQFSQEELVHWLSLNARNIFGLEVPKIETGAVANFTLFHPTKKWTFTKESILSKSKNSPFIGQEFTGKVMAIGNKGLVEEFA
ncbi:MAG: dihydroorotase [Polaribacter sp.]